MKIFSGAAAFMFLVASAPLWGGAFDPSSSLWRSRGRTLGAITLQQHSGATVYTAEIEGCEQLIVARRYPKGLLEVRLYDKGMKEIYGNLGSGFYSLLKYCYEQNHPKSTNKSARQTRSKRLERKG